MILNQNILSTQANAWLTSPKINITKKEIVSDQLETDSVSLLLSFETLPGSNEGSAQLTSDLLVVKAQTTYTFNVCLKYDIASNPN